MEEVASSTTKLEEQLAWSSPPKCLPYQAAFVLRILHTEEESVGAPSPSCTSKQAAHHEPDNKDDPGASLQTAQSHSQKEQSHFFLLFI